MSTPAKPIADGPRKSARKQKTRYNDDSTPAISESDSAYIVEETNSHPSKGHEKRLPRHKPNLNKKVVAVADGTQDARTKIPPSGEKVKATPIKQAYAGPTFHHSPAASALPLPSFYSKSMPTSSTLASAALSHDEQQIPKPETDRTEETPTKKESTPLDFLFDAARRAKADTRSDSPADISGTLSVPAGTPVSRSPGPRENDAVFPFEMDGADSAGEDGKSFATPFKARIAALQSTRSTSEGGRSMDDHERRAKTAALKQFLLTSQLNQNKDPMLNQSQSPPNVGHNNPFNARPHQHYSPELQFNNTRPRSGPSTPGHMQNYPNITEQQQYFPYHQYQPPPPPNNFHNSPTKPPPSSLRNVYGVENSPHAAMLGSDNANRPLLKSTRRQSSQSHVPQYVQGRPGNTRPHTAGDTSQKPSSTPQQLEDDLRRVLKLDLTTRG